jgi:hypothetical protein
MPVEYSMELPADLKRAMSTGQTLTALEGARVADSCKELLSAAGDVLPKGNVYQSALLAVSQCAIIPGIGNRATEWGARDPSYTISVEPLGGLPENLELCRPASARFLAALGPIDASLQAAAGSLPPANVHGIFGGSTVSFKTAVEFANKDKPKEPTPSGALYRGSDGKTFHGVPVFRMSKNEAGHWERRPVHPEAVQPGDVVSVYFSLAVGKTSSMAFISRYLKGVCVWAESADIEQDTKRTFELPM